MAYSMILLDFQWTKEHSVAQPHDMLESLDTSAIAHPEGLSMAFRLYFQPKLFRMIFEGNQLLFPT